jgi:hypothetical protein
MLVEHREKVIELRDDKLLEMADVLCHRNPVVRPIFECVKVFVRLHEQNVFTYARHPLDLGTQLITADQISSRMNDPSRERVVLEALSVMEQSCREWWPFAPGSSSWVLLEVLHPHIVINGKQNTPTIIFRKATRLNFEGAHSSTPLLERMFDKLRAKSEFVDGLLECNFDIPLHQNPGFYFSFEGETYSVRSSKFLSTSKNSKKKTTFPPLPISGFIK